MTISTTPNQNPEQVKDILNNNSYKEIISNISIDFENKYPGYNLKTFLENKPSLPLEVKVYNNYNKIVDKIPNINTLFNKTNKSLNDYKTLLNSENKSFFNNIQIQHLENKSQEVKKEIQIKELETLGLNNYSAFLNINELTKLTSTIEIKAYLNLLNKLDKKTINNLKSINLRKNIENQIENFSFTDIETVTQINALFTQNTSTFNSLIPNNFKKTFNKIANISLKNGIVGINKYYTTSIADSGLRGITNNIDKTSEVYIDYKQKDLNFPYKIEVQQFFDKNSKNINDILEGKITGNKKEILKTNIKNEFNVIIKNVKKEYGYIPWEFQEYLEKIDTLGKPNKKLIEFLSLFKSYLNSGVETAISKGNVSGDKKLIQKTNELIQKANSGNLNKLNDLYEGITIFDSYFEDRLEDFYEYLQEGLEYNLKSKHEVDNNGSRFYNSDLKNIDIFIDKFKFGGTSDFRFDRLKMALATHMVDEESFIALDSTNTYEGWNLVRTSVIEEINNATGDVDIKQEIERKTQERISNKNNDFEIEEVEGFKSQIRSIPKFTQEAILRNANIGYNQINEGDIESKLIDYFIDNAKNVGIRYATEQEVILSYSNNEQVIGKINKTSGIKTFLETFDDDWRGVKQISNLVSTEILKFAITTALTAGVGGVATVFARGGGYIAQGINIVGKTGSYLNKASKTGGILGNSSKLALGTARLGTEMATYTFISNWVDNGEFSMDHFVENFALVGGGIAGLVTAKGFVKVGSNHFKSIMIKYLGASSGSMAGELVVRFNDGTDINFLDLLKQGAIMGAMMLPMSIGRKAGRKSGDFVQGKINYYAPGNLGNNTGKSVIKNLTSREQLRIENINKLSEIYKGNTRALFYKISKIRAKNIFFRVGGPKIGLEKTNYLKAHYEGLNKGFEKFITYNKIDYPKVTKILQTKYSNIDNLYKKLKQKKTEWKNDKTKTNDLIKLEQDFSIWKAIETGQGTTYFHNKLFKIIESNGINSKVIKRLAEAHPISRTAGEVKNIGSHIKEGTVLGAKTSIEWIPAKLLKARRTTMEWGQYAGEGTRIRNKLGEYNGFNFITNKLEGGVLKLKGIEVTGIPKGHKIKSVETINVDGVNLYAIKVKEPGLKGKIYELSIYETNSINSKVSRIALENKTALNAVKKANGDIAYYSMKIGNKTKYYSKKGDEIIRKFGKKSDKLSKGEEILNAKEITPKEKIDISKKAKDLGSELFTNKNEYIKKFGKGVSKQTMALLKWIAENPGNLIKWGMIGGAGYYFLGGKAEEHFNTAKENINETLDETKESIENGLLEKMMEKISNMNPIDYIWNNND